MMVLTPGGFVPSKESGGVVRDHVEGEETRV
jgi:hypothetical protein